VEVDSSGAIVTSFLPIGSNFTEILRLAPGATTPNRYEPGVWFGNFVLESDNTLIASGYNDGGLYRFHFDTGVTERVFEEPARRARLGIDPAGRIIAKVSPPGDLPDQLLRIDLATGMTETMTLSSSTTGDFDLLIIPEPSALLLATIGLLGLVSCRLRTMRRLGLAGQRPC
jgi:hypothetical protein